MQQSLLRRPSLQLNRERILAFRSRFTMGGGLVFLSTVALCAAAALSGQQSPSLNPDRPTVSPEANRLPDANQQMRMHEHEDKLQHFDAANAQRKKELSNESAQLLTLAMALKAEVDKTNKDMLSLNVIRKADEIEKLAHNVKEKMKVTVGGS